MRLSLIPGQSPVLALEGAVGSGRGSHSAGNPGEREAAAARAGLVGRGFLAISGVRASWFRQASCVGVRVRGPRGASGVLA